MPHLQDHALLPLVEAAILAPSSHNTQPWIFRLGADRIDMLADRTRALPVNDPAGRELAISCGCALLNLRVASAAQRRHASFTVCPDRAQPDLLAGVLVQRAGAFDPDLAILQPSIAARRTFRQAFDPAPVPGAVLDRLATACAAEGAWLRVVESASQRHALAELVSQSDRQLWADPAWRRELASWMHPRSTGDGLLVPDLAAPIAQLVVRTFDMGAGQAARDQQLADGSPVLAVLGTNSDGPAGWMCAGQALQRLLLEAQRAGVQASFLNQPVQVPAARTQLQDLIGGNGCAQVVLRLGITSRVLPAAPRRPLRDVVEAAA
jgi:hypothetical protein